MTGITASNFMTSDEVDLEDGEIASDEEPEKPVIVEKRPNDDVDDVGKKAKSDDGIRNRDDKNDRRHGERRNRRSRFQDADAPDEPERKRAKTGTDREGGGGEPGAPENEDELLGLCVRGGSPDGNDVDPNATLWKPKATGHINSGWGNDNDDRNKRRRLQSPSMDKRNTRDSRETSRSRIQMKRKLKSPRKGVADKDVCLNYLKGACNKGNDCYYSHNVCQPRKMELCKFYLKDCCMKRDKCLYLHEEFPCKFFHTGLKCYANKNCKFSHEPLNNFTREVLLKHVETAPKDILGDFPRMTRENAEAAMSNTGRLFGNAENDNDDFRSNKQQEENESPRRDFGNDRRQGNNENFGENQRFNRDDGFMDNNRRNRDSPDQRFSGTRFDRNNSPADDGNNRFNQRGLRNRNDDDDRRRGDFDERRRGNNRNRNDDRNFGRYHDSHRNRPNNDSRSNFDNGPNFDQQHFNANQFDNRNNFNGPNFEQQNDRASRTDTDIRRNRNDDYRQPQQNPQQPPPLLLDPTPKSLMDDIKLKDKFPAIGVVEEEKNASGTSSPFDFAKELAEYKNKKMEMEILKQQSETETENNPVVEEQPEEQQQAQVVIEKPPQLLPKEERIEKTEVASETEFTQNYPPFPEKKRHHHHHRKKRRKSDNDGNERKSRKERKEKKRQPVIVNEEGSFGGIKFKIKLNPGKDEPTTKPPSRRPSEFLSSDDEIPLNYLQKRKDKDDGDETDTENRLVIETHDEPDEVKNNQVVEERAPIHLPRRQQRLYERIKSHQNDDSCGYSNSPKDRTPTPQPADADENWYSSDDENGHKSSGPNPPVSAVTSNPTTNLSNRTDSNKEETSKNCKETAQANVEAPQIELTALKDLSKINITQLLSSIRQITSTSQNKPQESVPSSSTNPLPSKISSHDNVLTSPSARRTSGEERPPYAKSMYEVSPKNKYGNERTATGDSDFRRESSRLDDNSSMAGSSGMQDVDLRLLEDGPLPPLKLSLPFKPAPQHSAATEIEASFASHPPIDYKVYPIIVPPPDFSHLKISRDDPIVKRDPRLRRLFRVSSADEPARNEDPRKSPSGPVDPRRKNASSHLPDTPHSPTDTPFSPPQETTPTPSASTIQSTLAKVVAVVQLGFSATAAAGTTFDPRVRINQCQEMEKLRAAIANLGPEDIEAIKALDPSGSLDIGLGPQRPNPALLPPPPGVGLLPTPPNFIMNPMMGMDPMMVGAMGPMGPMGPGGPMNPMNQHMNNFGGFGGGDQPPMNDMDMRMFRGGNNMNNMNNNNMGPMGGGGGGFKGDRRGGRNNWRGNPRGDRNWNDNRRHRGDRDDRNRGRDHRDKDDRRDRDRRSYTPD